MEVNFNSTYNFLLLGAVTEPVMMAMVITLIAV